MKNKKNKICVSGIVAIITLFLFNLVSYAEQVTPTVELYKKWNLQKSNLFLTMFRQVGWWTVCFMRNICNTSEQLFRKSLDFLGFGISTEVVNFISSKINPFIGVLLAVGITFFGIAIMMLIATDRNKIVINAMLLIISLVGVPLLMTEFTSITKDATLFMLEGENTKPVSTQILTNNVIDFKYVDDKNWAENLDTKNNLKGDSVIAIEIEENVPPDKAPKNKGVFENGIAIGADGSEKIEKVDFGGLFGVGQAYYYRYNYDFLSIFLTLAAVFFVFIFMSYKTIRFAYEIAFNRAFLLFVSPVDITVGAKTKKILMEMLTLYAGIIFIGVSFKLFTLSTLYISQVVDGAFARAIFTLFAALVAIDGPNVVEKVLGLDIGLKSSMGTVFGLYHGAKAIVSGAKSVAKGVGKVGSTMQSLYNSTNQSNKQANDIFNDNKSSQNNNNSVNGTMEGKNAGGGTPFAGVVNTSEPGNVSTANSPIKDDMQSIAATAGHDIDNNSSVNSNTTASEPFNDISTNSGAQSNVNSVSSTESSTGTPAGYSGNTTTTVSNSVTGATTPSSNNAIPNNTTNNKSNENNLNHLNNNGLQSSINSQVFNERSTKDIKNENTNNPFRKKK